MTNDEIVRALRCYASDCNDDEACFQCTFAWMCNKLDGNAPEIIAARIDSLTSQLAESQRREQAAVGIGDELCEEVENCYGRETALTQKWRGPQEDER